MTAKAASYNLERNTWDLAHGLNNLYFCKGLGKFFSVGRLNLLSTLENVQ